VAQAFHWFDNEPVLREMARVLRDGGLLSLVWNVRDHSVDWVSEIVRISGRDNSEKTLSTLTSRPYFEPFEHATYSFTQGADRDRLVAHVRSRSDVAALDEDEQAWVAGSVLELCDTHPALSGKETFAFPYVTHAFRALKQ
jgi:SAM-dependent methyltransferase